MQKNDANANTIGTYLVYLLERLWREKDEFSAKCPFGNSGWEYDLYKALVLNKAITGTLYEYEDSDNIDVEEFDEVNANAIIRRAILIL